MHVVVYYLTKHLHDRMKTNAASVCTRSSIIDRFWLNQCNSSSSGGSKQWLWTTQKMILLNLRKTNRNVRLRQLWNLVDCRSNKKDNNKFTRERKKNPEWKGSIRNKFQTLPMSVPICLNMYFFFIYALLKNNNTLVHIAHTTHNTARQCFKQPNEKEMGKQTKKQFEFIAIVQKLHPTGH